MYIVIIGCGRIGSGLALELSNEGHDVSVIDSKEESLKRLGLGFNGQRVNGVEIDKDILISAGIEMADVFLALTKDDNINLMATQIAKNIFKVPEVFSRVYEPSKEFIYKKLGIETISVTELFINVSKNKILNSGFRTLCFIDKDSYIIEIPIVNLKYSKLEEIEEEFNCIISAVIRKGDAISPSNIECLEINDKIICTINKENSERLNYVKL